MAEAKWIKLATDIFTDDKIMLISALPKGDSIILIWIKLLCLAGRMNNSGVFAQGGVAYTADMLATLFGQKPAMVKQAIDIFAMYGMIEIVDGVITIPNWGKYQTLDQLDNKKAYMKDYMRDYREKQKRLTGDVNNKSDVNGCKTNCKTNSKANVSRTDIEIDIEKESKKKNTKEKGGETAPKSEPVYSDDRELNDAIVEFIKFRKDIKKPMSDRAITLMMNKLESLSHDKREQVQILNQSIMQGWTGLYALKDDKKSRGQPRNVNPNGFANFKQTDHSEQLGQLEKMLADELNNNK